MPIYKIVQMDYLAFCQSKTTIEVIDQVKQNMGQCLEALEKLEPYSDTILDMQN